MELFLWDVFLGHLQQRHKRTAGSCPDVNGFIKSATGLLLARPLHCGTDNGVHILDSPSPLPIVPSHTPCTQLNCTLHRDDGLLGYRITSHHRHR